MAVAEQPKVKDDNWRALTPVGGPYGGLVALDVPGMGTVLREPAGTMCWLPGVKAIINDRDVANGGYKLVRRGHG